MVYVPHDPRKRLGESGVVELVAAYRAGATTPELAKRYGIGKRVVLEILHGQGLAIRKSGLTAEQIAEAHVLHDAGVSNPEIGRRFGVVASTVWRALRLQ